jgi:hypothetical protein
MELLFLSGKIRDAHIELVAKDYQTDKRAGNPKNPAYLRPILHSLRATSA